MVGVGPGETERRLGLAHLESLLQKGYLALAQVDMSWPLAVGRYRLGKNLALLIPLTHTLHM